MFLALKPITNEKLTTLNLLLMKPPLFLRSCQLNEELNILETSNLVQVPHLRLPGQPQIYMKDIHRARSFLKTEFLLRDLEEISPRLWMMSKQDHQSISPLHR